MSAIIVVDAFWGDSGKGKIAAYLAKKHQAAYSIRAGTGTNSGHSIFFENGNSIITHQLSCGWLHPQTQLRVGSGVAVDPEQFLKEIQQYALTHRTKVDFRCPIIEPKHKRQEQSNTHLMNHVGSTGSGTGAARADFILRRAQQAQNHPDLSNYITDVAQEINTACLQGQTIVIEGSQGTHLSLALTRDYPYCTSDNCTAIAAADDVGLNWQYIKDVVLIVKAVPSRVGEGHLPDELTDEEIQSRDILEFGVTTGRQRRKAKTIPWDLLKESVMLNGATQIALTFCDHFDSSMKGIRQVDALSPTLQNLITAITNHTQIPVTLIETGKNFEDIIDLQ